MQVGGTDDGGGRRLSGPPAGIRIGSRRGEKQKEGNEEDEERSRPERAVAQ